MATAEFHERKVLFDNAVQSGIQVLQHPDLDLSGHPYAVDFIEALSNATFGVIDVANGIVHATDSMKLNSVAIVPLTHADVRKIKPGSKITLSDDFLKEAGTSTVYNFSHIGKQHAECRLEETLVNPVILLTPNLGLRTWIQLGATVIHEMDHGYWDRNAAKVWSHGDVETTQGDVGMEVSAYSLEQRIFQATAPKIYADAVKHVRALYGDFDFTSRNITFKRGYDHLLRVMRGVAFINLMFQRYGIKPGDLPTDEFIIAAGVQDLVDLESRKSKEDTVSDKVANPAD